jgi:hypothetical protein
MKQVTASQKVMRFIPADKYLNELKLKAVLANKIHNPPLSSLSANKGKQTKAHSSRPNTKPLVTQQSRNFQVMLTGKNYSSHYNCKQ